MTVAGPALWAVGLLARPIAGSKAGGSQDWLPHIQLEHYFFGDDRPRW